MVRPVSAWSATGKSAAHMIIRGATRRDEICCDRCLRRLGGIGGVAQVLRNPKESAQFGETGELLALAKRREMQPKLHNSWVARPVLTGPVFTRNCAKSAKFDEFWETSPIVVHSVLMFG